MTDIRVHVELGQLASDLTTDIDTSDEDVARLIELIDENMADWSFTDRMYRYFKKEMKKAKREGYIND